MKPIRFKEWRNVFIYNYDHLPLWRQVWMLLEILSAIRTRVNRREWFRRMLRCCHCPMYLPQLRACGGCGCYMPYKALLCKHGWMYEIEHEDKWTYCWSTKEGAEVTA